MIPTYRLDVFHIFCYEPNVSDSTCKDVCLHQYDAIHHRYSIRKVIFFFSLSLPKLTQLITNEHIFNVSRRKCMSLCNFMQQLFTYYHQQAPYVQIYKKYRTIFYSRKSFFFLESNRFRLEGSTSNAIMSHCSKLFQPLVSKSERNRLI